tara:strand:+ start:705 stop:995 length:291 start_codon:yes stop_codon:yes gene_type:complete
MAPVNVKIRCDFDKCCPRKLKVKCCCCSSASPEDVFEPYERKEIEEKTDRVAEQALVQDENEVLKAVEVIRTSRKSVKKSESNVDRHVRNKMCIVC